MHRLHNRLMREENERHFALARGIIRAVYCRDSGCVPCDACRKDPRNNRISVGYFKAGTEPREKCHTHVLVDYDYFGGGVATHECPDGDVEKVGLIRVESRAFPKQIYVTDAQYVWRPIEKDAPLSESDKEPFFAPALNNGVFVGISKTPNGRQFNAACPLHRRLELPEEIEGGESRGRPWPHDWFSRYFPFIKS
jgi:hypothetical protein